VVGSIVAYILYYMLLIAGFEEMEEDVLSLRK